MVTDREDYEAHEVPGRDPMDEAKAHADTLRLAEAAVMQARGEGEAV